MPISFDPYHKWLGIPPEEQPPHFYRLLGLRPFEPDADVIGNAADQRMGLLKTFATSNYGSLAEDLLNEVARARVCLLNPEKKRTYDSMLRNRYPAPFLPGSNDSSAKAQTDLITIPRNSATRQVRTHISGCLQAVDEHNPQIDVSLRSPLTSTGVVVQRRKKSSRSLVTSLFTLVLGALVGLPAGYFVLCVIDLRYDFLHLIAYDNAAIGRSATDRTRSAAPVLVPLDDTEPIVELRIPKMRPSDEVSRHIVVPHANRSSVEERVENFEQFRPIQQIAEPHVNFPSKVELHSRP